MIKLNKEHAEEKYALVYTHKGIGIYALKVADPAKDEMGYRVDSEYLPDAYNTVGEAVEAIDKLF